jgi:hypothetical protein
LLRWYPKDWRSRYGDEFLELLDAEIRELPRSWRRDLDVARSGLIARLTRAGLTGHAPNPSVQARSGLVSAGCAFAGFLAFGTAMWAQLTIGWQWSEPDTGSTYAAMILMSVGVAVLCILAVLAVVPIAWRVVDGVLKGHSAALARPAALFVVGSVFLIVGSRHFGNGWPGTGGHPWSDRGLVPGGVGAFAWASTLWVSSYWVHPGVLLSFPVAELAWMASSPIAIICAIVGAARTVRRLDLSSRVLLYEIRLARVAALGMLTLLAGSISWTADNDPGPGNLFHTGGIDVAAIVAMGSTLAVAHVAVRRAHLCSLAVAEDAGPVVR